MRIGEKKNFQVTRAVELMDGLTVTVCSLPFGFQEQMEEDLPSPVAPEIAKRDPHGNPVYKDKSRNIIDVVKNEEDPAYKKAAAAQNKRQAAWIIYHGTMSDKSIQWETAGTLSKEQFFEAIYGELKASGIGAGYIIQLQMAILEVSGMGKEQIEKARAAFLSAEA